MSVGQLGRIAFGFAGDGLDAQLIDLSGGLRGENDPDSPASVKKVAQNG